MNRRDLTVPFNFRYIFSALYRREVRHENLKRFINSRRLVYFDRTGHIWNFGRGQWNGKHHQGY